MKSTRQNQTSQAQELGKIAFQNKTGRSPYLNNGLMKMIEGREIGKTPKGEASSALIMKSFIRAWDAANLDYTIKNQKSLVLSSWSKNKGVSL